MPRSSFLPFDAFEKAKSAIFDGQLQQGIAAVTFPSLLDDGIKAVRTAAFGDPTATAWKPVEMPHSEPLPMVTTDLPGMLTVPSAPPPPPPPVAVPPTPSGMPAAMPTGAGASAPAQPTGAAAPPASGQIEAYIRQAASARGINPDTAVAVARSEGGLDDPVRQSDVVKNGVRERSYGPFQLYVDGGLGNAALERGIDPRNPAHWQAAIDFSLDEAAKSGWGPWYGAARVGVGNRQGLETAKPIGVQASTNAAPPTAAPRGGGVQPPEQANAEAVVQSTTAFTRNQGEAGTALGLPWSTTLEICGPVAAAAFLRKNGRLPGREEAEAMRVAQEKGYWKPGRGMGGPGTTSALLTDLGVANKMEDGVDWEKVKADVSRGNPVIVDTSGHLFVVEGYDPKTGKFNFGESARFLKASGGNPWYRPEEVANLGMGAPRASIYMDNPETAAPSVGAGRAPEPAPVPLTPAQPESRPPDDRVQVISPEGTTMTVPRHMFGEGPGKYAPSKGWQLADPRQSLNAGAPSPSAPAAPPASPGSSSPAGAGPEQAMWSPDGPPYAPAEYASFQAAAGRVAGGGVMQRGPLSAAPQEVGSDGPMAPGPVPNMFPEPPPQPYGPPLSEAGPEMPTSYNDPTSGGTIQTPVPPPAAPSVTIQDGRTEPPTPNGDYQPMRTIPNPQRPPATDPGQWLAEDSVSTPVEVAGYPLTPPGSPYGDQQAAMEPRADRFEDRPSYGQVASTPGEPDYVDSRPQTVTQAIGQGIRSAQGPGGILEPMAGLPRQVGRMNEIGRLAAEATGKPLGLVAIQDPTWRAKNPELVAEYEELQRQMDMGMLGNMAAPRRVAQGAAQIAAPIVREAAEGVAGRAPERLPSSLGSGFVPIDGYDPVAAMRGHVVPPEVADTLDFPIRVPTDPSVIRAIESAGGRVDPELGVDLHVTRAQGPDAAGGVATRGMVFYEAIPEGGKSAYARGSDDPNGVGGSTVIPRTPTRFRSPLILSDAPGGGQGFQEGMEQMGVRVHPDLESAQSAANTAEILRRQAIEARDTAVDRWKQSNPGASVDQWASSEDGQYFIQAVSRAADEADEAGMRVLALTRQYPPPTSAAVEKAVNAARQAGPEGSPARAEALKEVVRRYGGTPDEIDELLAIRGVDQSESMWAIKENILAAHARRNGYDGVVTVQPSMNPKEYGDAVEAAVVAHPKYKAQQTAVGQAQTAYDQAWDRHNARLREILGEYADPDRQTIMDPGYRAVRASIQADPTATANRDALQELKEQIFDAKRKLEIIHDRLLDEVEVPIPHKITELGDVREGRNPTPPPKNPAREFSLQSWRKSQEDLRAWEANLESYLTPRERQTFFKEGPDALEQLRPDLKPHIDEVRRAVAEVDRASPEWYARSKEPEYIGEPGYTLRDDIPRRASTSGGSGFVPRLSDAQNAAQGGVVGAMSEATSDEELSPQERLARMAGGAALGVAAGRRMRPGAAGARVGSGMVPNAAPGGPPPRSGPIRASEAAEVSRLRLDKFPPEVRDLIEAGAREQNWAHTQRRGAISDDAVLQMAADDAISVDSLIKKGKAGKSYNAEETVALRNAVASQASVVRSLSDEIAAARANNMTPDLLIARRAAEATRLNGVIQVAEGARAEAGRTLRAYRQQAKLIELDPNAAIQQIYKRLGGKDNAEAAVDEYTKMVQDGANPIQMAKFWAKVENGKITGSDMFSLYRRFNMLSGPRTIEVNALSGAVNLSYEVIGQATGQAARGRVHEAAAEIAAPFKAMGRAFQNMAETARHGVSEEQALRGDIPRTLSSRTDNKAAKGALTVMELPDRFNAAVDQFYRTMTEDWAATTLAHKQARQANITPRSKDWAETVAANLETIRDDPSKFPEIKNMADHVTFSEEPGKLGKALEHMRRESPLIMNAIAPFIRTPYNIASRAIDMSPIGVARTAIEATTGIGRGRENISRRVRDNMIGVAGAVWAYDQAQAGNVTGAGPDDPEKRAMLQATGWQPYSVKIGDTYWSYANVAPFSLMLASGAAAHEAQIYAKPEKTDTLSMLADGAERTAKVVTDMTVLAGLGAVIKAQSDPDRYGGQWLTQYLQTLIPAGSALNTVGQMQDPNIRRAERDTFANQVKGGLASRLPDFLSPVSPIGTRKDVPAAQTPLGEPVPNNQTGAAALIPVRPSPERPDPTMQAFIDAKVDIGKPRDEISIGSVKIPLTPDEQRQWNTLRGQAIEQRMQTVISSGMLDRLPPAQRVERLERIKADAAERASAELWRLMPPDEKMQRRNSARKAG